MSFVTQGLGQGPGAGGGVTIERVITPIEVEIQNDAIAVELLTPQFDVEITTTQFILEGE